MRPEIKENIDLLEWLPFMERFLNIKYFFKMKKHMYKEEKKQMYKVMRKHDFNTAMEITISRYNRAIWQEKLEKDTLTRRYAGPEQTKEEKLNVPVPSVNEIKTFRVVYKSRRNGISMVVTDKVDGYFYGLIESSYLNKPKLIRGTDWHKTLARVFEVFNQIERDFVPVQEIVQPIQTKTRKARTRKPQNNDIDISHVEKAMGINPNESNNNNDNDLDDLLKGLF